MRSRLYLLAALTCVLALGSTTWSYDRPYVIHDEQMSTNGTPGGTLDDHPWGEDQSIANPNTNPGTGVGQRASAVTRVNLFILETRLYFINMVSRWSFRIIDQPAIDPGTTGNNVPTTSNSTTVSGGVQ
jgi:hypothetical protein